MHRSVFSIASALASAAAGQTTALYSGHPVSGGEFGFSVSQAPDVTGDGRPDVMVGAQGEAVGTVSVAGRVTIHSSVSGAIVRTLTSPQDEIWGYFGSAIALVPDFTGDDKPDIAVGARNENNAGSPTAGRGRVYLFNGATGALVRTIQGPGAAGSRFGQALAGLADINGDGRGDVLVGAPLDDVDGFQSGRVYLFSGATGTLLRGFARGTPATYDFFGAAVAAVPDTTGDGRPEIAIGAPNVENNGVQDAGVVYLYNGVTWNFIRPMCSGFAVAGGSFGTSVSGVPDVNGDGRGEVVIGAPGEKFTDITKAGRAYLFNGANGARLRSFGPGSPELYGQFGTTVAGLSDATGDGRGDVAIGAPFVDAGGAQDAGRIYIYSGATGAFVRGLSSPAPAPAGWFGNSLAGLADVNTNSKGEVMVGAPRESTAVQQCGRAYLVRN
jgi:hypothetical protein